jgi:uncharacterized protein
VKLVVREQETSAARRYVRNAILATSAVAVVEVTRAARIANPSAEMMERVRALLGPIRLVAVTEDVIRDAARHASLRLRALDAIHLASALLLAPDEVFAYDVRLGEAAVAAGLVVASPGA